MIGRGRSSIACLLLFFVVACKSEINSPNGSNAISEEWKSARSTHEGFRIYLRAPIEIDYSRAAEFPVLVVVTHTFTVALPTGLPEPGYNDELFEFDLAVLALLESSGDGFPVLVETFGGKRHYYQYAAVEAPVQALFDELQRQYPEHSLELEYRDDPGWRFRKTYAQEYGF